MESAIILLPPQDDFFQYGIPLGIYIIYLNLQLLTILLLCRLHGMMERWNHGIKVKTAHLRL
jgi:hypothetical protein